MSGEQLSSFSTKVEKKVIDATTSEGQRTVIQELEVMAVLGALKSWQDELGRHRVVLFTDSEAVGGSFLKSWPANEDSDRLMHVILTLKQGAISRSGSNGPLAKVTLLAFCQER